MENTESICINNNILKPGGAIGRLTYFWQGIVVGLLSGILAGILTSLASLSKVQAGSIFAIPIILLALALILLTLYACFLLLHKRCVDILGKRENAVWMVIGAILIGCIPYVGFLVGLYLLFAKGKISSPA